MIILNNSDCGKYFISVKANDKSNTGGLMRYLSDCGFTICKHDEEEILIDLDSLVHKLSLNELRKIINQYCDSTVYHFTFDEEGRCYDSVA